MCKLLSRFLKKLKHYYMPLVQEPVNGCEIKGGIEYYTGLSELKMAVIMCAHIMVSEC